MVVNGKYMVSARSAGGQAEMLQVVDFLVAKERAAPYRSGERAGMVKIKRVSCNVPSAANNSAI